MPGQAADLYSFGVLLWEMICGARAWESLLPPQVMIAVSCQGQRLEFPHKCPAELARCARCTASVFKTLPPGPAWPGSHALHTAATSHYMPGPKTWRCARQ